MDNKLRICSAVGWEKEKGGRGERTGRGGKGKEKRKKEGKKGRKEGGEEKSLIVRNNTDDENKVITQKWQN